MGLGFSRRGQPARRSLGEGGTEHPGGNWIFDRKETGFPDPNRLTAVKLSWAEKNVAGLAAGLVQLKVER